MVCTIVIFDYFYLLFFRKMEKLSISAKNVNNHRRNLLEKLNVTNSSEDVKLAIKLEII